MKILLGSLTSQHQTCFFSLSSTESSSDASLPFHHSGRFPPPLHDAQHDVNKLSESHHRHLRHHRHHRRPAGLATEFPDAAFRQEPPGQRGLNLLARPHREAERAVVSARHLVTVVSNGKSRGSQEHVSVFGGCGCSLGVWLKIDSQDSEDRWF